MLAAWLLQESQVCPYLKYFRWALTSQSSKNKAPHFSASGRFDCLTSIFQHGAVVIVLSGENFIIWIIPRVIKGTVLICINNEQLSSKCNDQEPRQLGTLSTHLLATSIPLIGVSIYIWRTPGMTIWIFTAAECLFTQRWICNTQVVLICFLTKFVRLGSH